MRLIRLGPSGILEFVECDPGSTPKYAILSHTWGLDSEEVTFDDISNGTGTNKAGYAKIGFCARQAQQDGLDYFWVDTCCINRANFTELSKAINLMFSWYQRAEKCYVYLVDVSSKKRDHGGLPLELLDGTFNSSRWFTRGWTLQELLAPKSVAFFSREGVLLGDRQSLGKLVQAATGIPPSALRGESFSDFTVGERMRWAEHRSTKEPEDKWYSLLGLFGVNMTLIYGEGENAENRLKDEIGKSYREQLNAIKRNHATSDSGSSATERRKEVLATLAFEQMDARRATIKAVYATTCQWFLEHPAYLAWLDPDRADQHFGFIWVRGKPGAGKSTLMKFVHAHALENAEEKELIISFFFNARGDELERSVVGMYRSLLSQLLQQATDLHYILDKFVPARGVPRPNWTIDSLRDLLATAVKRLGSRRIMCFVDALDECDEEQVQEMIDHFEELGQNAPGEGNHIYICFASRHYPAVHVQHGLELTLEHEEGHSRDLAKYVQQRLRAGKGKYLEEARAHICEKANGVFMWAVLVVEILNKEFLNGRTFAVKKRLHEIPAKLSDLFKDILRRDHDYMDDLLLCLQWVLFAKRPLRREEFYYAMLSGLEAAAGSLSEWDPERVTIDDMNRYVLSSSKGLAELTKSQTPTVQFIHEAVRDFLIKDGGMNEMWANIGTNFQVLAHDRLKHCCETYINNNSSRCGSLDYTLPRDSAEEFRVNLGRRLPFLEYAGHHLLYHADEAASMIPQKAFLKSVALSALIRVKNAFERYEKRRYTANASLQYLLADGGHARLVRTARQDGVSFHVRGERYRFPFFAALAGADPHVLDALLGSEDSSIVADLTQRMKLYRNFEVEWSLQNKSYTPLLWAIREGHIGAAERLVYLTEAYDLNARDEANLSALSWAVGWGYLTVLDALIARNIDINAYDDPNETLLCRAVGSSRTKIVRRLLEHGADVKVSRKLYTIPLVLASLRGNLAIVRLLLDHSADVNASTSTSRTALQAASEQGYSEIVSLLLSYGADVDAGNGEALRLACRGGHEAVVRTLLAHGGSISRMRGYRAELDAARKHESIVQLLLADLTCLNNDRATEQFISVE
ncbi:hypothetical protein LTR97_003935 [Elasticomyces elasticus]|uniref:Heterokaryon incompatibility domain-containing protein n=1 Tax=Elasticomyces elasticus TaxID=574655 RepID=A0AAN8A3A0_9PEZI|nr:hypothetical protein LTR97_003935 [Elasticomyces elasticus]